MPSLLWGQGGLLRNTIISINIQYPYLENKLIFIIQTSESSQVKSLLVVWIHKRLFTSRGMLPQEVG